MSLDTETREAIEGLLNDNRVVLFMKGNRVQPQCGFSAKVVSALDMLLPEYTTIDVLQYPDLREGIKAYGNWPTIPQLYVGGELVGGSDIVQELFASGELGDVLGVEVQPGAAPSVTIDQAAQQIISSALESRPGMAVHLKIDAAFEHSLSLAPPRPDSIEVTSGSVTLQVDAWSAARADGLRIGVKDSLQGQGFSFDNPKAPPPVEGVSVKALKAEIDRAGGNGPYLFDVRGDEERAMASIPGARPWDEDAMRVIDELPKDTPLYFHCHKGGRSLAVAERYRRRGYTRLYNVEGGVDAWSREIDSAVPRY